MQKQKENPARLDDERLPALSQGSPPAADPIETGRRVSEQTNVHDAGSDANDTPDGLTEIEEAVRRAAEDIPVGQRPEGSVGAIPVFDRGRLRPKV